MKQFREITPDFYHRCMRHLQLLPTVALITTGRTGSDFLQSLLDSHPQIATFNGHFLIYSEFFSKARTFSVPIKCPSDAADEFIGQYIDKLVSRYDFQEAKDCLGPDSNESFRLDTVKFKAHLIGLIGQNELDSRKFLLAIYGAYNLCLGHNIEDFRVLFHHPHLESEFRLFWRDFPQTRILFSTRDPRANFFSHVDHFRRYYPSHDNQQHIFICLRMAFEDSELADKFNSEYTAIRLEDLPREEVMGNLANWLGVDFKNSMLKSTWAGLEWHGDRISVKRFPATGWSSGRTENGWRHKLGFLDRYILNFIMYSRLQWYGYPVTPIGILDAIAVAFLILFPFKCERRLMRPGHIFGILQSRNRLMLGHLLLNPFFLVFRIGLCYKHYWRTVNNVPFRRNWLRGFSDLNKIADE
jgi:hypothetical protein